MFPAERYECIQERLSWLTYQRVVFRLHVHVGVPSRDMEMGVIGMLLQYLPHLLAVSTNSPFWHGVDTGLSSTRVALYRLLPHAGVPRHFRDWKEFRSFYRVMRERQQKHFEDTGNAVDFKKDGELQPVNYGYVIATRP